jgi:hypothetical protein
MQIWVKKVAQKRLALAGFCRQRRPAELASARTVTDASTDGESSMRTPIYVLAALAAVSFGSVNAQNTGSQGAQGTGNAAASPGAQAPVRQPQTSAPASTPAPSAQTSPTPSQPTQSSSQTTTSPSQPTQSNSTTQQTPSNSSATTQQTVRPPDSMRDRATTTTEDATNNANNRAEQERVPPASRGVGTTSGKPDCSKLRGLEKAECERRDTVRDDLPAGVTSTQPKSPQQ